MILSLLPITNMLAQAALGYDFTISGSKSDYTYVGDTLTITGSGKVTISGTSGHHKIVTAENVTARALHRQCRGQR